MVRHSSAVVAPSAMPLATSTALSLVGVTGAAWRFVARITFGKCKCPRRPCLWCNTCSRFEQSARRRSSAVEAAARWSARAGGGVGIGGSGVGGAGVGVGDADGCALGGQRCGEVLVGLGGGSVAAGPDLVHLVLSEDIG